MTDSWATYQAELGRDLHLDLTGPGSGSGLRTSLRDALREAARTGRLAPGTRLPSSRSLAADLGIARNTVADAYAELVAEGWLTARQGSGTRIAARAHLTPRKQPPPAPQPLARTAPAHNLMPGTPDLSTFPRADWLKASRKALTTAPNEAFGYGDPRGRIELRTVLAAYLARTRGVHADPERLVIRSGYVNALTFLADALRRRSPSTKAVATESYGLAFHRACFTAAGLRTPALGLDERGSKTEELSGLPGVGAALLTAAHQFPTGVALHPDRRAAAVDWARRTGGLILEDDYDGEFRYDRQPVGALQGLDPDRVVYLGTTSKALAPGLRLSWAVLPPDLLPLLSPYDNTSSALEQLTLAEFMASGAYDRHVRAKRLSYRRRRDDLVAALAAHAPHVRTTGIAAGLHAILELPPGTEREVVRAAHWQGLAVEGLATHRHPEAPGAGRDGLMVGYATPSDRGWPGALGALIRALGALA
ncbi:PLP-dependent aminotransferase family protein [Streptomyces sp. NBC_00237]|uniref:MocR-like pyridoxine biosynthesis transcription factor PdxR n=1 Tax=Streptomyces sp. NBC_00237 TaxID=2975687 RepID=UPI00224D2C97|nr:PLP-dependent aminotransferase family protein [Streptomyces sp. NBC_00237]MCX5204689.1 PLP-dependent aminotransferase family protein [Streptomyces sp. NBC_00237]